jgi:diguanylate cyclase (GGDEF)-like protein
MTRRIERRVGLATHARHRSTQLIWLSVILIAIIGGVCFSTASRYADTASDVNSAGQLRYRSLAVRELLTQQHFDLALAGLDKMDEIRQQMRVRQGNLAYLAERAFDDFKQIAVRREAPSFEVTMNHVESADRLTSVLAQTARGYLKTTILLFVAVFLVMIATIANLLYTNSRLVRAESNLQQLASTDGLTGLWNRRRLYSVLAELQQVSQPRTTYCVILTDLDNFKWINDQYGHGRGDEVLTAFSAMLRSNEYCECYRYGGEEFAITVVNHNLAQATAIAETLRANLEQTLMAGLAITSSFGVAQGHIGDSASSVLERADRALYIAKNGGRNRVANETDVVPRPKRGSDMRKSSVVG